MKHADEKKTWEGSLGMVIVSTITGVLVMLILTELSLVRIVMRVCITALAGAYVELISHNGNDTVTVPSTNIVVLLILHYIGL